MSTPTKDESTVAEGRPEWLSPKSLLKGALVIAAGATVAYGALVAFGPDDFDSPLWGTGVLALTIACGALPERWGIRKGASAVMGSLLLALLVHGCAG